MLTVSTVESFHVFRGLGPILKAQFAYRAASLAPEDVSPVPAGVAKELPTGQTVTFVIYQS
jgi:hypothetical protein